MENNEGKVTFYAVFIQKSGLYVTPFMMFHIGARSNDVGACISAGQQPVAVVELSRQPAVPLGSRVDLCPVATLLQQYGHIY